MADILDVRADNIADEAKKAKNRSVEAYEQIKTVNSIQQNVSDAARKLNEEVQNAEFRLNRTREWTEDVSTEAREVLLNRKSLTPTKLKLIYRPKTML